MILFVHGWCYDASMWDRVKAALPGVECRTINLGFFGQPDIPDKVDYEIAVGHSLGVLWLLHHGWARDKTLVAVNGFARFEGRPVLEQMKRGLSLNPKKVVADFRAVCGDRREPSMEGADILRLREGLDWLGSWDDRPALDQTQSVHVLASRADRVVQPAMTERSFAGRDILWHDSAHHVLPLEEPQWVARHIKKII